MPPSEIPFALWILLGTAVGLQALTWLGVIFQGRRLRRIEARLARGEASSQTGVEEPSAARRHGHFERFLHEDPARRALSKKEQSAAFRKWRAEQGLNWDGGGS